MLKTRAEVAHQLQTARKIIRYFDPFEREVAYHEAGHALVATLLNVPVAYVSIRSRGYSEGRCVHLAVRDEVMSKSEYLHTVKLVIAMAGLAAAKIGCREKPLWRLRMGASGDIKDASEAARAFFAQEQPSNLKGRRGRRETEEEYVERVNSKAYFRAKELLTPHRHLLHLIAAKLLQYRYLHGRDLARLIDGRTQVRFMVSRDIEYIFRFGKEGEVARTMVHSWWDGSEYSYHPTLSDALRDLIPTPDNSPAPEDFSAGCAGLMRTLRVSLKDRRAIRARLKTETQ